MDVKKDKHKIDQYKVEYLSDLERSFIPDTFRLFVEKKEVEIVDFDERHVCVICEHYFDNIELVINEEGKEKNIAFKVKTTKEENIVKAVIDSKKSLWKQLVEQRDRKQEKAVDDMDKYKGVG